MPHRSSAVLFVASLLRAACALDDSAALVQAGLASRAGGLSRSIAGRAVAASSSAAGRRFSFDCAKHPKLCEPPFNCHTFSDMEWASLIARGTAHDGHGNLRSWCTNPDYEDYMHTCIVKKDLVAAAHIQYQRTVDKRDGVDELDASYCFIEGHCSNSAVTNETTLEEADRMCDMRYGDDWRDFGKVSWLLAQPKVEDMAAAQSKTTGFHNTIVTTYYLKMACAMGNYHCDVMYCKETYCKNPYYVKKYSHLLPKAPGHLLQSRTRV